VLAEEIGDDAEKILRAVIKPELITGFGLINHYHNIKQCELL